tara:strand:- start:65841 stop:67010 length:1170 start_codon:yes stop_codon:yes gene_type:complete
LTNNNFLFTSESVSEGHPDKIADKISDSILDYLIKKDPNVRTGIETVVTSNLVILLGETSYRDISKDTNIDSLVRDCVRNIGYEQKNFHWKSIDIMNKIHLQSPDIAMGVESNKKNSQGAGDQGIMFGYATDETPSYMPAPLYYANKILLNILNERKLGNLKNLGPDAKSQVTLLYENGIPTKAHKVLVSSQHSEEINSIQVKELISDIVIKTLPNKWMPSDKDFLVNPTGKFVIGGPHGDAGLTGRKIIVDTYGGAVPHGGGAFSGKDPTKVDRSAAYISRYLAKNIVHAKLSKKCLIQLSYAIGQAEPLSFYIKLDQNMEPLEDKLTNIIKKNIDLSPWGIQKQLKLNNPIYTKTSCYGHFGREPENDGSFSWEKVDLADKLLDELS